jgi:hypothetical protein
MNRGIGWGKNLSLECAAVPNLVIYASERKLEPHVHIVNRQVGRIPEESAPYGLRYDLCLNGVACPACHVLLTGAVPCGYFRGLRATPVFRRYPVNPVGHYSRSDCSYSGYPSWNITPIGGRRHGLPKISIAITKPPIAQATARIITRMHLSHEPTNAPSHLSKPGMTFTT